jgi:two-component system OmpR family sensor kinase
MRSLRSRLLLALLAALLFTGVAASAATYLQARAEIDRILDYQLRQQALALRDNRFRAGLDADPEQDIVVQVWDRYGAQLYLSHRGRPLPRLHELGYADVTQDGERWRVYAVSVGSDLIQVGQPLSIRRKMAADAALRLLLPVLAALPLFGALIWWILGRGLMPLNRLAASIGQRAPSSLSPLPIAGQPAETVPMVRALNDLLARLEAALRRQREFTADAAHELRTPLTAVRLQAQLLERASSAAERAESISALRAGVERAAHLIDRLLLLARLEPEAMTQPFAPVDLAALAAEALEDLRPAAAAKSIRLSMRAAGQVVATGDRPALQALLRNLVENAVRYTQAGGSVEVGVDARDGQARMTVTDDGPGIPAAERSRVLDRFYRCAGSPGEGSGLGLAIAERVATLHGATLELTDPADHRGLCVRVTFPTLPCSAAAPAAAPAP